MRRQLCRSLHSTRCQSRTLPRPAEDAPCARRLSSEEKRPHRLLQRCLSRVVARVPMLGGALPRQCARRESEVSTLYARPGISAASFREEALDPCVHDEPHPSLPNSYRLVGTHFIRYPARSSDGGRVAYNAMFKKPVQLICGHDMAMPMMSSERSTHFWGSETWLPLVPTSSETCAFTSL
jgi:hypothetical protein